MHRDSRRRTRTIQWLSCSCLLVLVACALLFRPSPLTGQARGAGQASGRDWTQDMAMKITEPFTISGVGDLIIMRPSSQFDDPAFQSAIKLIKDADVGFGNFETNVSDMIHFTGPMNGFMGDKGVPADVKKMGFTIVNRANNHLFDSGQEGMYATNDLLDQAGVVYAGSGRNLEDARAAHFLEIPKGRIGLVSMTTLGFNPPAYFAASYRYGNTGGRPGLNGVDLTRYQVVSPEQLEMLRKVRDAVYERRTEYSNPVPPLKDDPPGTLQLFGEWYKAGDKPGDYSYVMNPDDLREILRSIRNGKEYSDFMILSMHTHDLHAALTRQHFSEYPPDFLIDLAHKAIDTGADVFMGSGVHVLRGIEVYKGKPIFYGLGEFFRQMDWTVTSADHVADGMTDAEAAQFWDQSGLQLPINYESVITQSQFNHGQLQQIRLYPIVGGQEGPISRRGIPRLAQPDVARSILERLQTLSKPFGTTISIQGSVGVIQVTQGASTGNSR